MEKNKKNYKQKKQNYYHKTKKVEKKVTYNSLMHAKTINEESIKDDSYDKVLVMKYIAVSVVLFAIIVCSFIIFRSM